MNYDVLELIPSKLIEEANKIDVLNEILPIQYEGYTFLSSGDFSDLLSCVKDCNKFKIEITDRKVDEDLNVDVSDVKGIVIIAKTNIKFALRSFDGLTESFYNRDDIEIFSCMVLDNEIEEGHQKVIIIKGYKN